MKVTDLIGNELNPGDLVAVDLAHVVAVVAAIETGEIARGILADGKPQGQQVQPHLVFKLEMSGVQAILPNGQCPGLLKVHKPEAK